jgi:molybdate transport system substrate-binding protein
MSNNIAKRLIMSIKNIFIFLTGLLIFTTSCNYSPEDIFNDEDNKKQMLIYCGITMIRPMAEIAEIIEKQEDCKISIIKGGSGNLLDMIVENEYGDLYLPGSDRYYEKIAKSYPGLITDTVTVGFNKAVLMVQKGNPLGFGGDLKKLTGKDINVVIGDPASGSIGKEAKKILTKAGIFDEVINNAPVLTTDSKDLVTMLKNKTADVVINWYACSQWDSNSTFMQVIDIDSRYSKKKRLVLGLIRYSQNKELAKKFMELASSERGKMIFDKYGLYHLDK